MPHRFSFKQITTLGEERTERSYTITYLDDPPERREQFRFLPLSLPAKGSKIGG